MLQVSPLERNGVNPAIENIIGCSPERPCQHKGGMRRHDISAFKPDQSVIRAHVRHFANVFRHPVHIALPRVSGHGRRRAKLTHVNKSIWLTDSWPSFLSCGLGKRTIAGREACFNAASRTVTV